MRNRRYVQRLGPLVVFNHHTTPAQAVRSMRNVPGVDLSSVWSISLRKVAPGGHLGRFILWTSGAFKALDKIWGTIDRPSLHKKGYHLPRHILTTTDITKLIQSEEVNAVCRPSSRSAQRKTHKRANPLKSHALMRHLNPYADIIRRNAILKARKPVDATKFAEKRKKRHAAAKNSAKKIKKLRVSYNKLLHS